MLAKKIVRTGRNKRKDGRVESQIGTRMVEIMPRPLVRDQAPVTALAPGVARTRYLVVRQEDVWFIKFDGEEFDRTKASVKPCCLPLMQRKNWASMEKNRKCAGWKRSVISGLTGPSGSTLILTRLEFDKF